ncbi:MGA_1079 family surface serine endopeptidase [Mycoplasmopsis alligatoris]|uniref:Lipoprotein n=1 Tax=Mycoplasmopsis alligatoris A21JP2 TaxID=747682 RepID=D4XV87_9BACT|nr:hypothetical protein [Mycoplasmopsis alligatoris]EFF41737.1 hypothetical protein MALL_0064 [Mycoplasmopsis alligatoris A21JP2]
MKKRLLSILNASLITTSIFLVSCAKNIDTSATNSTDSKDNKENISDSGTSNKNNKKDANTGSSNKPENLNTGTNTTDKNDNPGNNDNNAPEKLVDGDKDKESKDKEIEKSPVITEEIRKNFEANTKEATVIFKKDIQEGIDRFKINLYSGSINKENFKVYFGLEKGQNLDYELKEIKTDKNNNNLVNYVVLLKDKKSSLTKETTVSHAFDKKIDDLINEYSKTNNLSDYFSYDTSILSKYQADEMFDKAHPNRYKEFLTTKVNRYFTYDINTVEFTNSRKADLKLNMYLHDKKVKEFSIKTEVFKGSPYFNLTEEEKEEKDVKSLIARGNLSLELRNPDVLPTMFMASEIDLNKVFKTQEFKNFEITIEKEESRTADQAYSDKNAFLYYKYKVTNKTSKKTYQSRYTKLEFLKKPNDPDFDSTRHNDEFFKEVPGKNIPADLKNKVDKINGTNFELRLTNNFSYLDPENMTGKNLKYFLKFVGNNSKNEEGDKNSFGGDFKDSGSTPTIAKPGQIYLTSDQKNDTNINELRKNYFIVFFDVNSKLQNSRSLTSLQGNKDTLMFKIGFISKNDPSIKYASKTITLTNLSNTLADTIYPINDLNNIRLSNLDLNVKGVDFVGGMNTITADTFAKAFKDKSQVYSSQYKDFIKVIYDKKMYYKKYDLERTENSKYKIKDFEIANIKEINDKEGSLYVQFKYKDKLSNNWIKIEGFKNNSSASYDKKNNESLIKELGLQDNLIEIQNSDTSFLRKRKIEFNTKTGEWNSSFDKKSVNFLMKKMYYEPIFENTKNNLKNRFIYVSLPVFFNNNLLQFKEKYLNDESRYAQVKIDYNELTKSKKINFNNLEIKGAFFSKQTTTLINVIVELAEDGIKFLVRPVNNEYKITQNPKKDVDQGYISLTGNEVSDKDLKKDIAIYFDKRATKIYLQYENNLSDEKFVDYQTNKFDYEKVTFTQENEPIILRNKSEDIFKFNFNQNVSSKWNEGYKPKLEYLHEDYEFKGAKDIKDRTFAGKFGSWTMLRKLNNDPIDYKYYLITNQHVIGNHIHYDMSKSIVGTTMSSNLIMHAKDFSNDYFNGEGYWSGAYTTGTEVTEFWNASSNQKDKNGNGSHSIDANIVIVDIKSTIDKLKRESKFEFAAWLENWSKLEPLKISYENEEFNIENNLAVDYVFSGFPYGKKANYIYHRVENNSDTIGFSGDGISPIYHNSGNSGTGVMDNQGNYISIINSGSPRKGLTSWKLAKHNVDYYGLNDPFKQKNDFSIIAHLLRANAYDPSVYELFEEMK